LENSEVVQATDNPQRSIYLLNSGERRILVSSLNLIDHTRISGFQAQLSGMPTAASVPRFPSYSFDPQLDFTIRAGLVENLGCLQVCDSQRWIVRVTVVVPTDTYLPLVFSRDAVWCSMTGPEGLPLLL
jgi:hypothetical protein